MILHKFHAIQLLNTEFLHNQTRVPLAYLKTVSP